MKTIRCSLLYFLCGFLGAYLAIAVVGSRWQYELQPDGSVKRAWHVMLPGYQEYLNMYANPPVVHQRFTMRAFYRVGPWIDPEWMNKNNAKPANRPVGRD